MRIRLIPLLVALLLICHDNLQARFAWQQTQAVPISRVLKNFEQRLAGDTNNVGTLYALARIHSMAYATNLSTVKVTTNGHRAGPMPVFGYPGTDNGLPASVIRYSNPEAQNTANLHLTNAITYYQRAATLVLKGTNSTGMRWLISPIHLGLAWCLDESGRRDEAIKAYRRALQLAWNLEVDDKVTFKEQMEWSWDQIRAQKNPVGRPPTRSRLGLGVCYSEEIISYLLKLLDPVKDAKEIAQLQKDKKTLASLSRPVTPILIPLQSGVSFEELVNPNANITFDLDGTGLGTHWGWITPKAAWLVFDHDGTGRITSGLQLFGNVTFWIFWRDGYEALSALDNDGNGTLAGSELRGLSLWQDINSNGICEPGEVRPVSDWGITTLECRSQLHSTGIPFHPHGVVFSDGTTRPTFDWIVPSIVPN